MQTAALKCDGDGLSFSMGDRQEKRLFFGKKTPKKTASILDTFSCVFQGIIPYGAQMLVAISAATGLGETINAFDILPLLFYPYMLLLSSLVFISFEKNA